MEDFPLSNCSNVDRFCRDRITLLMPWLAVFLASALVTSGAAAQVKDSPSPASAQQQTQAAPSTQPQETQSAKPPSSAARPIRRRRTVDDQVKVFATALNLSETQQVAVKRILEQRQQETLRLRNDPSISGSDRIDRFRALQDKTVERIRAVLNDEQKKKYNPLAVRKVTPSPDQKSVEDWLKATSPH